MNKYLTLGSRFLMGTIFLVFGINGLLFVLAGKSLFPMPPPSADMATVMQGFFATKYLMPLVKVIEIASGLMLLSGKYLNLAIALLGSIVVNILGLHLFVDTSGAPMAIVLILMWGILLKDRWSSFKELLKK